MLVIALGIGVLKRIKWGRKLEESKILLIVKVKTDFSTFGPCSQKIQHFWPPFLSSDIFGETKNHFTTQEPQETLSEDVALLNSKPYSDPKFHLPQAIVVCKNIFLLVIKSLVLSTVASHQTLHYRNRSLKFTDPLSAIKKHFPSPSKSEKN